jgi:hypothetical protein
VTGNTERVAHRISSERVGDVSYFGETVAHDYRHNVEAEFTETRSAIREPCRRQAMQSLLFAPPHRFRWLAPPRRVTGLDLAEHKQGPACRHDVDLTQIAAVILLDNSEPLFLEVLGGELFAHAPEAGSSIHTVRLWNACDTKRAHAQAIRMRAGILSGRRSTSRAN